VQLQQLAAYHGLLPRKPNTCHPVFLAGMKIACDKLAPWTREIQGSLDG